MDRRTFLERLMQITGGVICGCSSALHARSVARSGPVKTSLFNANLLDDIYASKADWAVFQSISGKLRSVQRYVGFGNFNLLSFDELLRYSRYQSSLDDFTKAELDAIERIFEFDARAYGFFGPKIEPLLTAKIPDSEVTKVPYSGHFLLRNQSLEIYRRIEKDLGNRVILTSGVRSVVKQLHLFLRKVIESGGNLSRASRSLAPPGYSYHAVGDFDIGKRGFGLANFTSQFAETAEYRRLMELGYIDIRYPADNQLGVRFEPWHIEGAERT